MTPHPSVLRAMKDWVGKPIRLFWYDAERHDNCCHTPADFTLCPCETFGELAYVDETKTVVLQQKQREENDYMVFPTGCVYDCHCMAQEDKTRGGDERMKTKKEGKAEKKKNYYKGKETKAQCGK